MTDPYNGKYCKHCRHFDSDQLPLEICTAEWRPVDPLTGPYEDVGFEKDARLFRKNATGCGPEGKLWEPKE